MWKLLKLIGLLLRSLFWLLLLAGLAGLVALYVLERGIPAPLVRRAEERLSTGDFACRIGRATFSVRSGLHLYRVNVFPKRVAAAALVSFDDLEVGVDLRPGVARSARLRGVTLRNVRFPALPPKEKRPAPGPAPQQAAAPGPEPAHAAAPLLPAVDPFPLVIEQADILGLRAESVSATVEAQASRIAVSDVAIKWPDKAFDMTVKGFVTVDLAERMVRGGASGQAFPANILPLLEALRSRGAIKQVNCFSKLERPVNAQALFDVNIDNSDFALTLDLDVGPCAYREVPMRFAKGTLRAYGTNIYTTVDVGPIQAESDTGPISGHLVYREESESLELSAQTSMALDQVVKVINILNHGELKPLRCDTPPRVEAQGIMAIDSKKSTVTNSLSGRIAFDAGSIFNLNVRDVTADLKINGYSALIDNIAGTSACGGPISGNVVFTFPNYSATATLFTARAKLTDVDLADLSRMINVTNARAGLATGHLLLHGRASNRTIPTLSGEGTVAIRDGLLHRMPLFAGFTDYLARTIPGLASLVNQSSGSMDFTIRDGILRTDNLLVEGDLFSMHGRGSCNLETEELDFLIRANIFKERTFAGKITRFVTAPFSRLLLEFKVFGTRDKTDWSYVSIIERITDSLSDRPAPRPPDSQPPPPAPEAAHPTP